MHRQCVLVFTEVRAASPLRYCKRPNNTGMIERLLMDPHQNFNRRSMIHFFVTLVDPQNLNLNRVYFGLCGLHTHNRFPVSRSLAFSQFATTNAIRENLYILVTIRFTYMRSSTRSLQSMFMTVEG